MPSKKAPGKYGSGKYARGLSLFLPHAVIASAVSAACLVLLISRPSVVGYLDNQGFDLLVSSLKRHPPSGRVVIVDIDESSLAKVGKWPWPRGLLAKMIQQLAKSAPSVIALDVVLPEADPVPSAEQALAAALRQSHSVIGFDFVFGAARNRTSECAHMPSPLAAESSGLGIHTASAVLCDLPRLELQAAKTGFLNSLRDRDGITRRVPLLAAYRGGIYPSFALSAATATSGSLSLSQEPLSLRWNGRQIECSDGANMLLRYRGAAQTMPRYPAYQLLAGKVASAAFTGKIVVIGSSVNGIEERLKTPRDPSFPGVEMQATAIDNLVAGDYFLQPGWAQSVEIAAIVALSFLSGWLLFRFPSIAGIGGTLAAPAIFCISSEFVLAGSGAFISPVPAVIAAMATLAACSICFAFRRNRSRPGSPNELALANRFITGALGAMTAVRDVETGQHVIRIQGYLHSLCEVVSANPKFRAFLTPSMIDLLVQLAPIHDIGKVGVPDYILRKPGVLSEQEFEQMKAHVTLGKKILEEARRLSGLRDEMFFKTAMDIVYSHHEWWDGTGYPLALSGESIPIPGRLLAVADVYDALISKRSYKPELLHAEAVEHIRLGAGSHFDPEIVAGFLAVQDDWRRMAEAHRDEPGLAASAQ